MQQQLNIIIDCDIPYLQGILEPHAFVTYLKGNEISASNLHNAEVLIIRTRTICNERLLKNSSVKLILTATIGYDHIDMEYCKNANIRVETAAGCNARGVLQWFAAVMAHLSENMNWMPQNRTLGVVGVGNVGSLISYYAKLWGFKVLCCDPYKDDKDFVTIDTIYKLCDIITFHVPCTTSGDYPTFHMLDSCSITTLKQGTIILNASRGEVVCNKALKNSRQDLHYVIDTWEGEPNLNEELLLRCSLSTPHIAGYSAQGKANGTSIVVRKLSEIYDLPLKNWYPHQATPTKTRDISWSEMKQNINDFYDITADSKMLKDKPQDFENLRNNYKFRQEFF